MPIVTTIEGRAKRVISSPFNAPHSAPEARPTRMMTPVPAPAFFASPIITEVSATHNGNVVLTADWGSAVSKNPFLQFVVKGAKAGDKIGVTWTDTKGDTRTDEATAS